MPKARGRDVEEVLLEMEEARWADRTDEYEIAEALGQQEPLDYTVDSQGVVKPVLEDDEWAMDFCSGPCCLIDPAALSLLTQWIRSVPKDISADPDVEGLEPFF